MHQSDLCRDGTSTTYRMHRSEISELCNAMRPLTKEKAQDLIDHFFPDVLVEWLMGQTDIKTKKDLAKAKLWNVFLDHQKDRQQFLCLDFFMQHYGYRIEQYPEIDESMDTPDLRKALDIMSAAGGITYRISKDGEIIRELTSSEFIALKDKIGKIISVLLES